MKDKMKAMITLNVWITNSKTKNHPLIHISWNSLSQTANSYKVQQHVASNKWLYDVHCRVQLHNFSLALQNGSNLSLILQMVINKLELCPNPGISAKPERHGIMLMVAASMHHWNVLTEHTEIGTYPRKLRPKSLCSAKFTLHTNKAYEMPEKRNYQASMVG